MTEQENLRVRIEMLKAMIQFDLRELEQSTLSPDERRAVEDHVDKLLSEMQPLLERVSFLNRLSK